MRKLNETKKILTEWKKNIREGGYDDYGYDDRYSDLESSGDVDYYDHVDSLESYEDPYDDYEGDRYKVSDEDDEYDSFGEELGNVFVVDSDDIDTFGHIKTSSGRTITLKLHGRDEDYERRDVVVLDTYPSDDPEAFKNVLEEEDVRFISDQSLSEDFLSERGDDIYEIDEWLQKSGAI